VGLSQSPCRRAGYFGSSTGSPRDSIEPVLLEVVTDPENEPLMVQARHDSRRFRNRELGGYLRNEAHAEPGLAYCLGRCVAVGDEHGPSPGRSAPILGVALVEP